MVGRWKDMVGTDLTLVYKLIVGESWCRVSERDVRGLRSRKAIMAFTFRPTSS